MEITDFIMSKGDCKIWDEFCYHWMPYEKITLIALFSTYLVNQYYPIDWKDRTDEFFRNFEA